MLDIISQMKVSDLMLKFVRGDLRHITHYPFAPQKKANSPQPVLGGLPWGTPESEGVPSEHIRRFFEALDRSSKIRIHSVMILRHGKVIAEGSFKPFTSAYPHMMFSLAKSITGMAVGMLVRDGLLSLDEKIVDIFSDRVSFLRSPRINSITVLHLLNMTSGIKFNEAGSAVEKDWVRAFLQSDCQYEPGTEFSYNSMNSYLLAAIVCKKAGMSLTEYLTPRLFRPLGIQTPLWETCPMGIEKGGWGLYLRTADMAKLGQLYLQGGSWKVDGQTRQLIPEDWIAQSVKITPPAPEDGDTEGYGYQIWDFGAKDAYQFNGLFGQFVIVLPERDMVLSITSGSPTLFTDRSGDIVKQYFGDDAPEFSDRPLPNNFRELRALKHTLNHLYAIKETAPKTEEPGIFNKILNRVLPRRKAAGLSPAAAALNGRKYRMEPSFGTLMPLILQCVTNNFSDGVSQLDFSFEPGACSVTFRDSETVTMVEAGLDGTPRIGTVTVHDETYAVGATARLTFDEDDRPVLKLFVSFLETPCTKVIKFVFYEDNILVRFNEYPSVDAATRLLFSLVGGSGNTIDKMMGDAIRSQRMAERMGSLVLPRAKGVRITDEEPAPAEPEESPEKEDTSSEPHE